jgi:hypothetical protein
MDKLRKTIREMVKSLSEAKQHTDDEIVDFDEIDLQDEYNKLNGLIFGGKLKPVEMIWNTKKSAHGTVKAQRNRITGEITIKSLGMSKFLDVSYKVFKNTLAHEMIHVFLLQQGINDGHGYRFKSEMSRINSLGLGFNVSVTLDGSSFSLSKHAQAKAKEMVFFLLDSDKTSNMLILTTPNIYRTDGHQVERLYGRLVVSGKYRWVKGEVYKSSNPQLMRYTQNKSFRTVTYITIDQSTADELKSDAEMIHSFAFDSKDKVDTSIFR